MEQTTMYSVLEAKETQLYKGTRISDYRLHSVLKKGGMSTVYLGYNVYTQERVAIKMVASDSPHLEFFTREVYFMQAMNHDCILPCLDAGQYGPYHYMVMPYLGGGTLEDLIEERPLTLEETQILLEQLSSALSYMHAHGIVHRDIKPTNILFDENYLLYLADFGISSTLGEKPIHNGQVMGTAQYIAPEVLDGYLDERSDIYSVGILLYQALTGHLPFDGENRWKICLQHKEQKPLALSIYNPAIPHAVEQVILRALEKDPNARYQSMKELFAAFQKALEPSLLEKLAGSLREVGQHLREHLAQDVPVWQPVTAEQQVLQAS
ncbi:MAG TPA: serine/threonine-protein kinase [Ktedonobacteraceae bacterium]|jgi:serine/threonine-protein kinase|nr:serine/threonine-protein kinase [Ktedonobacteraceae bacterium]